MPIFFWFIFAHFRLCFLSLMVMNLLIITYLFPDQKAKKLGPRNFISKHILFQSLWKGAHLEARKTLFVIFVSDEN